MSKEKYVEPKPSKPRPKSIEKYIGGPKSGIDIFHSSGAIEIQQTMAKQTLTIKESKEYRRLLEIAEICADQHPDGKDTSNEDV